MGRGKSLLCENDLRLIRILFDFNKPIRLTEFARKAGIKVPVVLSSLKRLEKWSFVKSEVKKEPNTRVGVYFSLTSKGIGVYKLFDTDTLEPLKSKEFTKLAKEMEEMLEWLKNSAEVNKEKLAKFLIALFSENKTEKEAQLRLIAGFERIKKEIKKLKVSKEIQEDFIDFTNLAISLTFHECMLIESFCHKYRGKKEEEELNIVRLKAARIRNIIKNGRGFIGEEILGNVESNKGEDLIIRRKRMIEERIKDDEISKLLSWW